MKDENLRTFEIDENRTVSRNIIENKNIEILNSKKLFLKKDRFFTSDKKQTIPISYNSLNNSLIVNKKHTSSYFSNTSCFR